MLGADYLERWHQNWRILGTKLFCIFFPITRRYIYLEVLIRVDENGNFGEIKEDTKGALIERDRIKFIEFFEY